jgi:Xaa-Pro aminopeptidase
MIMKKLKSTLLALLLLCALIPSNTSAAITSDFWDEPGVRLLNQPVGEYKARRARLMSQIKDGIVVILGNVEEDMGIEMRYRQNNWFAYLTGVRTPAASVMLVPQGLPSVGGAREIIFIPPRDLDNERWTGVQLGPGAETAKVFGAEQVLANTELWAKLKEAAGLPIFRNAQGASTMKLYTIAPRALGNGRVREYQFVEQARAALPGVEIVSVANLAGEMRRIKSQSEINLLQKAIDITGEAQRDIALNLKPGMYEYEIQALLEAAFTRNGAERPGFPSIVGSGIYSTILHYSDNHKKIDAGDLVVCDIGAEYSLYTADITRTYPASGKFTPRQREIYQLVLDTQTAVAAHWKPGMTNLDLHVFAVEYLRKSPLRAKDTDGREYTMDRFFIHGLGHALGMDVHDVADGVHQLQPGEVFTIEPGIYIQTEKLGVRIEDDYQVMPDNTLRKLSARIPSTPDEIEKVMASGKR